MITRGVKITAVSLKPFRPKRVEYKRVPLKRYRPVPVKPNKAKPGKSVRGEHKGIPMGEGRSKEICPVCGGEIMLPTT